ncbi:peptidylprolyl isomerase [Paucihalobacter ruber]|uniref:peptidylprolyl isomerase n=1 Tax=Paucihalobacter ruber TaxID=2567861 RepID=A0A506PGC0_9FLAO|nr:peptidylprolyl isomerase [Paucihalobacter ruber]TPV32886.1 peptidylprolyl isomerase [Paucihalobacter ruber]
MIKNSMLYLAILLSFLACKEQYPELEDGIYAEFVTNKGTMVAKLTHDKTPVTVANFVALAEGTHPGVSEEFKGKRFYDSLTFHRVIDNFMIQGGDPTGTGSGSPGYKFEDEFHPELKHNKPGILSMANSGPNTNGSQFFITEVATPHLDAFKEDGTLKRCGTFPGGSCHTVFGELVLGLDIQDSISNIKTMDGSKPETPVIIKQLNIIRKGSEAKKFNAADVFTNELPKLKEQQERLREEAAKKAEEEQAKRDAKNLEAATEVKVLLDEYLGKSTTLDSGLKIYTITKGNGPKPAAGSTVKVNYEGYFTDGRLFDTSVQSVAERHGMLNEQRAAANAYQPMPMPISPDAGMVAGFKETAALMKVGDKVFAYMPSHLAWGERGAGGGFIPPNADVIFIMEMVGIVE